MAITYPLASPTHVKPSNITFRAVNTVGLSMSPFTYQQQSVAHAGQRWECDVTLPAMARADAEQWIAFLVSRSKPDRCDIKHRWLHGFTNRMA